MREQIHNQSNQYHYGTKSINKSTPETPDDRIADWTEILGIFTGLLVVVSGLQIYFLIRADRTARDASIAARRSADVAERALEDASRPYIFVDGVGKLSVLERETDELVYVEYFVGNYGRTPAVVTEARAQFIIKRPDEHQWPDHIRKGHSLIISPVLCRDERRGPFQHNSMDTMYTNDAHSEWLEYDLVNSHDDTQLVRPRLPSGYELFFRVIIKYRGTFTEDHTSSACWRYDRNYWSFVSAGEDTNYET